VMSDWEDTIINIINQSQQACDWLVTLLSADSYKYLKPYLLARCRIDH